MSNSLLEIREATESDLVELEICCQDYLDLIPNFREDFCQKKNFVFLALLEAEIVGALAAFIDPINTSKNLRPIVQMVFLFVNPPFRNQRVGNSLIIHFLREMQSRNFAAVRIELFKINSSGMRFLQDSGFRDIFEKRGRKVMQISLWDNYGIIDENITEE